MIATLLSVMTVLNLIIFLAHWRLTRWPSIDDDVRSSTRFTLLLFPSLLQALALIAFFTQKEEWSVLFALACLVWFPPVYYLNSAVHRHLSIAAARRRARNAIGVVAMVVFILQLTVSALIAKKMENVEQFNLDYLYDAIFYCCGGMGLATVVAVVSYHVPFAYLREHREAR